MQGHNVVAIYNDSASAARCRDRLISEAIGIPPDYIRLSNANESAETSTDTGTERPGFWNWLFATDLPQGERDYYNRHLRENRVAVSAWTETETQRDKVIEIMDECGPAEILDEEASTSVHPSAAPAVAAGEPAGARRSGTGAIGARHRPNSDLGGGPGGPGSGLGTTEREEVVPVIKEELDVSKRQIERRGRVRIYTTEHPVTESVTLRDERVEIERRPVSREATPAELAQGADREIEVVERHEEPIAEKRGRVTEEVVVRTEATEHEEQVSGTVQETHVEVEEPGKTGTASTAYERQAALDKDKDKDKAATPAAKERENIRHTPRQPKV